MAEGQSSGGANVRTQSRLFLSPPHMGGNELKYVIEAFDSNYVAPAGPMLTAFERAFADYTGFAAAVAVASGTAALHLALRILGVERGEDVFAPTMTFIGGVEPINYEGAHPVFIDCDPHSWNMDLDLLEEALADAARAGRLPRCVIGADLYGQAFDLDRALRLCAGYDVPLISDSAEGLGSLQKAGAHAGKGAWAAGFSFNGNKIITTSGGGMLASDDPAIIERARYLSTQARQPFPHYEHVEIGYNYRMSNISAAIGLGQLEQLEERVARRRAIFSRYRTNLAEARGIGFQEETPGHRHTRWLSILVFAPDLDVTPEQVRLRLETENIESRPVWKPMHLQPVYRDAKAIGGSVAADLFARGLCLPSGSAMTYQDVDRVSDAVLAALAGR